MTKASENRDIKKTNKQNKTKNKNKKHNFLQYN